MIKKVKRNNSINKIVSVALVLVMVLLLGVQGINTTLANPDVVENNATILYFEQEDTVFEVWVETGTSREELGLPAVLRAVLALESENNQEDNDSGSQTATVTSLTDAGQIDGYEIFEAGIPVTWEGYYDGNDPGEYTLTAQAVGYEYDGEMPSAIITVGAINTIVTETGSISGFLWVDGNGDLDTDWDGLYDDDEYPLQDYPVSLYDARDLSSPIAATRTNEDGIYTFENLEPGSYVLGVIGESVEEFDFLPPVFFTADNRFEIDWSIPGLPAYTEVIELAQGQKIGGINAGMRLPMGMAAYKATTLANLGSADVNDTLQIDGYTWVVVKKTVVGTGADAIKAVYLITRGTIFSNVRFGPNTDYADSELRTRMKRIMDEKRLPTIQAMALIPDLGAHNLETALTIPTAVMAGSQTQDILFAPSRQDMVDWTGVPYGTAIPSNHPLSKAAKQPFSQRFWFRTSRTSAEVYGYIHANNSLEGGLHFNGTNISDVPAVWVNAGAVNTEVTVYYVDTDGNSIGVPTSKKYDVTIGSAFSLPSIEIPNIDKYKYIEWRKSLNGAAENFSQNPNLTKAEVAAGTNLYLVYEDDSAHKIIVHYVDEDGESIGVPPDTYRVDDGDGFTLDTFPTIYGYRYTSKWYEGSISSPIRVDEVKIPNVISDMNIFLIFDVIDTSVAQGNKNAYVKGSATAENGSASSPIPVEVGDSIRYTITTDNKKQAGSDGARYDVLFVLDWSDSMNGEMVPGQSARLYERDVMLDMFDFIIDNYSDSRVAVMAMNSNLGLTTDADNTYIQFQTDFLNKTQYAAELQNIRNAFNVEPRNHTEDLVSFLRAANQKIEGVKNQKTGSSAAGGVTPIIPRDNTERIPVMVLISDFQIPKSQGGSGTYWTVSMAGQSDRFATYSPNGILMTVRFDHRGNTIGGNAEYSTFDGLMREYVSPRGHDGKWGFTKVSYGTSYTEALRKIKSDFITFAPPGDDLGTIITDKVPVGLTVDTGSISHKGAYDPDTHVITWNLSEEDPGEITVEFNVTVAKVPGIFRNKADITYYDGIEGSTNSTYHESSLRTSVDVTISKTVTGGLGNKRTLFEFSVYLVDENGPGINAEKEFKYTGGVISGTGAAAPANGVLVLSDDMYDSAVFHLSHGQTITIHDVPIGTYIMVVETLDESYTTEVRDSKNNSVTEGHFTEMQPVGDADRRFDFINDRDGAVPTGVDNGTWDLVVASLSTIALLVSGMAGIALIKRRQVTNLR